MTFLEAFHHKLTSLGVASSYSEDAITVEREGRITLRIKCDEIFERDYAKLQGARSRSFRSDTRILQVNNSIEVQLIALAQTSRFREGFTLDSAKGDQVTVGASTNAYAMSLLEADAIPDHQVERMVYRIRNTALREVAVSDLVPRTYSARFKKKGAAIPSDLEKVAIASIRSSLFALAMQADECLEIWTPRKYWKFSDRSLNEGNLQIPKATYDTNVVSFYKVAKSSPYPSQSFLAFYNCLEYYFLQVAETKLHAKLAVVLNDPCFKTTTGSLDKVVSIVKGDERRNDETEMLRNVLDRYVDELEMISLIERVEKEWGESVFTKRRKVFGEDVVISKQPGHVVSNVAKTLKHIRNAIVHSTDRYSREECHVPLSASEDIIAQFVPLIMFSAERVIFGTSSPSSA